MARNSSFSRAAVELVMPQCCPEFGLLRLARIERSGKIAQMFFDVKSVNNLNGFRVQFLRDIPDPRSAVADYDGTASLGEASAC